MQKLLSMSIKVQLLLIVFIVALPAVGVILYSGFIQREVAYKDAQAGSRRLAESIASEQQNAVAAAQQLVSVIAQLPHIDRSNLAKVQSILANIHAMNAQYSNIFLADRSGMVWASAVPAKPFSIADRRYFINALATGQFSSGEYVISRATSRPSLNFGYPLRNPKGEITGVISVGFNMESYRNTIEQLKLPKGSSYALFDHSGTILARAIDQHNYIGKKDNPELFKRVQQGPDRGTFIGPGLDDRKRFTTYIKFRLKGEQKPYMYIRTGVPLANAVADANLAMLGNLAVFVPFLLFALAIAWLIGKRSILDRVVILQAALHRFAAGDLQIRVAEVVKGGELGDLGESLDEMARQLAAREQALRESEEEYRFLAENSADIIWRLSPDRRITYINPADQQLRGFPKEEVLGRLVSELIPPEDAKRWSALEADRMANESNGVKTGISRFETSLVCKNGASIWAEVLSTPVRDKHGEITGFHGVVRDMSERKVHEERLLYLSAHDPLTGLYNRTHFEAEFNRAGKGRSFPLSVIIGDVDGLKAVNDSKGHAAGDILIKAAADILKNAFRVEDLVARIGGDEFAVLMANADEEMLEAWMERVREGENRFNASGLGIQVRLSLGGATAHSSFTVSEILHQADKRMYADKARHKANSAKGGAVTASQ